MPMLRSGERVAGAAPAALVLLQYAAVLLDIAQRRIGRAFLDLRPLGRGELALEVAEQAVQQVASPVVEGGAYVRLPEARSLEHAGKDGLRAAERAAKAGNEPAQPRCYVEIALLRRLENVVVVGGHRRQSCRWLTRADTVPGAKKEDDFTLGLRSPRRDLRNWSKRRGRLRVWPMPLVAQEAGGQSGTMANVRERAIAGTLKSMTAESA